LDVYAGPISSGILNVFRQDPNVKTVADRGKISEDDPCTFSAILVQKDLYESGQVRSPEDMAGLKVAGATYSIKGYELDKYLALAGLTFDDVEIVNLPTSALVDALNNKAVDAIVTPEFTLTRLMMTGNAAILSRFEEDAGPMQTSILAFGSRLIKDDPELGVRFLAAYLKGVQKYNEGKTEENLQAIADLTGEDIDLLKQACWPAIRSDGWIDFSDLEPYLQWNIETGQMDFTITEEQFWDPSILEAALALLDE
jgi:ABC-type nitrate/sulfonate/bicarbonate transport system substrate-binding protein